MIDELEKHADLILVLAAAWLMYRWLGRPLRGTV